MRPNDWRAAIVQEFMEGKNLHENENERRSSNWEVNNPEVKG